MCGHWAAVEFLAGMGIAEIGLIQSELQGLAAITEPPDDYDIKQPVESNTLLKIASSRIFKLFLMGNLVFALFVAGWSTQNFDKAPGISMLWRNTMKPFSDYGGDLVIIPWYALSAIQIVVALQQIESLQGLFVTPLAQYLADISYTLYLIHGPMQTMLLPHCLPHLWNLVSGRDQAGLWGRMIVWFCGKLMIDIPTIWASDLLWRAVDTRSVQLARWVESICLQGGKGWQ